MLVGIGLGRLVLPSVRVHPHPGVDPDRDARGEAEYVDDDGHDRGTGPDGIRRQGLRTGGTPLDPHDMTGLAVPRLHRANVSAG
jgi:hypothetical protein